MNKAELKDSTTVMSKDGRQSVEIINHSGSFEYIFNGEKKAAIEFQDDGYAVYSCKSSNGLIGLFPHTDDEENAAFDDAERALFSYMNFEEEGK